MENLIKQNIQDVFILATGYSLNNLTAEEKEYIKSRPTIAVGHYLVYWEQIGILPDHFIFPGEPYDYPTRTFEPGGLYNVCNEIIRQTGFKTKFWASGRNIDYLKGGEIPADPNGNRTFNLVKCTNYPELKTGKIDVGETHGFHSAWATNLDEKFLFASSISTAINLAAVLYPGTAIKMVGNDGGTSGVYFYSKKSDLDRKPTNRSLHYNMVHSDYSFIKSKLNITGNLIFNVNKKSWFTNYGDVEKRRREVKEIYNVKDKALSNALDRCLFKLDYKTVLENNY